MRMLGPVESCRGFGLHDHFCWIHGDPLDYRPHLSEFFSEGLESGLRAVYAGLGRVEELRDEFYGLVDGSARWPRKAVRIVSFDEVRRAGEPVDPVQLVKKYAAETAEALTDGYQGLRVSADLTDLVSTPEQQDSFARAEFLLERYSSRHPLSAMCAYRLELGDAVTQFACMHAAAPTGLTPFQIFACGDGAVGLLGEFDVISQGPFERALKRIQPDADDAKLIFDMSMVGFMDHRALLSLDSYAEACPVPVAVRSVPPVVSRLARMLELEHLGHLRMEER